jgi:hypothetical protein
MLFEKRNYDALINYERIAPGFKGDDGGFNNLFIVIWQKAVDDDAKTVKFKIFSELTGLGISKDKAHEYIDKTREAIEQEVRCAVYEEALNYPATTKSDVVKRINKIVAKHIKDYMEGVKVYKKRIGKTGNFIKGF